MHPGQTQRSVSCGVSCRHPTFYYKIVSELYLETSCAARSRNICLLENKTLQILPDSVKEILKNGVDLHVSAALIKIFRTVSKLHFSFELSKLLTWETKTPDPPGLFNRSLICFNHLKDLYSTCSWSFDLMCVSLLFPVQGDALSHGRSVHQHLPWFPLRLLSCRLHRTSGSGCRACLRVCQQTGEGLVSNYI